MARHTMDETVRGVVVLIGLVVGTSAILPDGAYPGGEAKPVTITEKDADRSVELKTGQTLEVRLPVQAGTGYTWLVAKNDSKVLSPVGKPRIERPKKPLPGGRVTMVFTFRAAEAGRSDLELHYKRPFEKDKKPAKTLTVKVQVQ